MNNVSVREVNGDVAVGMSGFVVFKSDVRAVKVESTLGKNTSVGIAPAGEAGNVNAQPSTRVLVDRCLRVFSWARMVAPAECNQSFPSVWSKCQWVLIRCLIGSEL